MMNGWGYGMDGGWWVLTSVFWIALVVLIVWAAVRLFSGRGDAGRMEAARQVLDRRLASGEIDPATYDQLRERLDRGALAGGEVRAMKGDRLLVGVLVAGVVALGGTAAWAAVRTTNAGLGSNYYGAMMGRYGPSMMGGGGNGAAWYLKGSGPVRDLAAARAQAKQFADRLGLTTGEVMQFANNFYVLLEDKQGNPATEVLVDPQSGSVTLEYGPAMMWNTRYGMMSGTGTGGYGPGMMGGSGYGGMMGGSGYGGMMGGSGGMMGSYGGSPSWTPAGVRGPVDVTQAQALANQWLAEQSSGLTAGEPDALPGYFTFHTLKDGKITGMLSVNARTGAVWYHWWHGRFIAMEE